MIMLSNKIAVKTAPVPCIMSARIVPDIHSL